MRVLAISHKVTPVINGHLPYMRSDSPSCPRHRQQKPLPVSPVSPVEIDRVKRDRPIFHSIRYTVATRLARRPGPYDLMDVMGWRTVQMAMRYVHSNEDAKCLGPRPTKGRSFNSRDQAYNENLQRLMD